MKDWWPVVAYALWGIFNLAVGCPERMPDIYAENGRLLEIGCGRGQVFLFYAGIFCLCVAAIWGWSILHKRESKETTEQAQRGEAERTAPQEPAERAMGRLAENNPPPITKSLFHFITRKDGIVCVQKGMPEFLPDGIVSFRIPCYENQADALAHASGNAVHLCGRCGKWHIEHKEHLPRIRTVWECDKELIAAHSPIAVCGNMKSMLSFGFFEGGEPNGGFRVVFMGGWKFIGETGNSYDCLLKWGDGAAEAGDLWAYEEDGFAYIAGPLSLDEIKECESLTVVLKSPKGEGVIFSYSFQGAAEAAGMIVAAEQKREAARQERKEQQEWENKLREKQVAQGLVELDGEKAGYVYALSNELYDGLYKIGMTTRTVKERLRELNSGTGVPKPFKAEFIMPVKDAAAMEKNIHQQLRRYHERKEFFRVPIEVLAKAFEL